MYKPIYNERLDALPIGAIVCGNNPDEIDEAWDTSMCMVKTSDTQYTAFTNLDRVSYKEFVLRSRTGDIGEIRFSRQVVWWRGEIHPFFSTEEFGVPCKTEALGIAADFLHRLVQSTAGDLETIAILLGTTAEEVDNMIERFSHHAGG